MKVYRDSECACLTSCNDCLKRYIDGYDVVSDENYVLEVCNEYLKLKMAEKRFNNTDAFGQNNSIMYGNGNYYTDYYDVREVFFEVVKKHIELPVKGYKHQYLSSPSYQKRNDIFNHEVPVMAINRPAMYLYVPFKRMLEIIIDHPYHSLRWDIVTRLKEYLSSGETYKKYKTKYNKIQVLLNKGRKTFTYGNEQENQFLTEAFILMLEINSK